MYNWKLPHVNSPLNVWQHTIFEEVVDRTLWSIKSRSAVFLKLNLCENKRKRTLVRIPSIFSNIFVWATIRRAKQLHRIYPVLAAGRYLAYPWNLSKLTMLNRKPIYQDMCGSEHTLEGPIYYRTLNSSSKFAELKRTLVHKCISFSTFRLFQHFLMSARCGSTRYYNTLTNKISSVCIA